MLVYRKDCGILYTNFLCFYQDNTVISLSEDICLSDCGGTMISINPKMCSLGCQLIFNCMNIIQCWAHSGLGIYRRSTLLLICRRNQCPAMQPCRETDFKCIPMTSFYSNWWTTCRTYPATSQSQSRCDYVYVYVVIINWSIYVGLKRETRGK